MPFQPQLQRQTAIVTGAAHGIGQAIGAAMARAGAAVVINDIQANMSRAQDIACEIEAAGGTAVAVAADVSREDDVHDLFGRAVERFGTVHILVNNAGIQRDASIVDMTLADWQAVLNVNLTGQFLCAREAAREFLRRQVPSEISRAAGKIICISSVHQVIPWAFHVNYAASKGGVAMMMETLAQELAVHRIRVNSIAPGAIRTSMNESSWGSESALRNLLKLVPYGRIGVPEDIARAAVWLASDEADYVNGTTLVVDGGMTLYPSFRGNG